MSTEKTITSAIIGHFSCRKVNSLIATNVTLLDSPWEVDAIGVSDSYFFTEFEVKLSVSDYRRDFEKSVRSYALDSPKKHELYSSPDAIDYKVVYGNAYTGLIPKPAYFWFVTPKGLLDGFEIPAHCGHLEHDESFGGWNLKIAKSAPRLKKATKLNIRQIYNLACKESSKVATLSRSQS